MTTAMAGAEAATIPPDVRDLLAGHGLAPAEVRFAAASATRIDTGGWLRGANLFLAVVGERFVLAAAGPRPLVRVLPLSALARAVYNHVTGELAFPPVKSGPSVPTLRIDPFLARSLFDLLPSTSVPGASPRA
jgi:hypothetical protein